MASIYSLTFLLKEGESIAYHHNDGRPISYITSGGMDPKEAMAETVKRLILAGYVNNIHEITGLTKEGDVEIYGGFRCRGKDMPKKTEDSGWNYIRSLCFNKCFLFATDLKRVVEAVLDWQEDNGVFIHEDDGYEEKMALMDYLLEKEGPYYGKFMNGLYRNGTVMEAALQDPHLIDLYREDRKTLPPARKRCL